MSAIQNLNAGYTIEHDFGLTSLEVQESIILREGVRKYTNRNGILVEQPCIWLQGITSVPEWNKYGQGFKPSYHFKVHLATEDGETESYPVSAFGKELVDKLSSTLDFRQAFIRLKKVDVRQQMITAKGSEIAVTSLAVNFINQVDLLAVFAPRPSAWEMAAEALSKQAEGGVEPVPF